MSNSSFPTIPPGKPSNISGRATFTGGSGFGTTQKHAVNSDLTLSDEIHKCSDALLGDDMRRSMRRSNNSFKSANYDDAAPQSGKHFRRRFFVNFLVHYKFSRPQWRSIHLCAE